MYTVIKLTDKFILVSDEEIKEGDWYWTPIKRSIEQCVRKLLIIKGGENDKKQFKIIAGTPELPSIDFSLLSEEDCKTTGWVNVEKLADDMGFWDSTEDNKGNYTTKAFVTGFKTAQSLNDNQKLNEAIELLQYFINRVEQGTIKSKTTYQKYKTFIQSLQQTSWNVEVEMEDYLTEELALKGNFKNYRPKITNNSIKVIKLL